MAIYRGLRGFLAQFVQEKNTIYRKISSFFAVFSLHIVDFSMLTHFFINMQRKLFTIAIFYSII